MKQTQFQFRFSIVGYFSVLTTVTGMVMFVVSLFLPATGGGETGLFMLCLGIVGSFGGGPSGQPLLQGYSLLGSFLNLMLWVPAVRWVFSSKAQRRSIYLACGVSMVAGFIILTLFPVPNSDGAIGYRVWVSAFLFGGVGILLAEWDRNSENNSA